MEEERYYKKFDTYVDGNTVRKTRPMPNERQERIRREQEEQRARRRKIARRNQEREMRMNRRHLIFLSMAVGITCLVCAAYIQMQSQMNTRMNHVAALEKELADLKTENDTTLKRINTSIDLNKIKKEAMEKMGMVYASEGQVSYYNIEDTDYMTQLEEIPKK